MHNSKESVLSTIVYNTDCLEAMKQFEDKHFDLAIVDPPYGSGLSEGGGCQGWFAKYREDNQPRNNGGGVLIGTGSFNDSTDTNIKRISRGGFHGKHYSQGSLSRSKHQTERKMGLPQMEGTRSQKKHFVGCSAETGIF